MSDFEHLVVSGLVPSLQLTKLFYPVCKRLTSENAALTTVFLLYILLRNKPENIDFNHFCFSLECLIGGIVRSFVSVVILLFLLLI